MGIVLKHVFKIPVWDKTKSKQHYHEEYETRKGSQGVHMHICGSTILVLPRRESSFVVRYRDWWISLALWS
jgi:hypothetical protein